MHGTVGQMLGIGNEEALLEARAHRNSKISNTFAPEVIKEVSTALADKRRRLHRCTNRIFFNRTREKRQILRNEHGRHKATTVTAFPAIVPRSIIMIAEAELMRDLFTKAALILMALTAKSPLARKKERPPLPHYLIK